MRESSNGAKGQVAQAGRTVWVDSNGDETSAIKRKKKRRKGY